VIVIIGRTANGINHIAFYEFAPLVYQKRVSHVDRFAEILSIEANEIGHLLAFDVDEAQHLPLLHVKGGIAARSGSFLGSLLASSLKVP
jgi:hypothetical protein